MTETESTDTTDEPEETEAEPDVPLSEKPIDEWTEEELANQDWDANFGGEKTQRFEFKGTVFQVSDPEDDDTILNLMAEREMGVGDSSDRMFKLCNEAIDYPELTPERWAGMRTSERIGLLTRVSEKMGLQDMMDFQELGQQLQQDASEP